MRKLLLSLLFVLFIIAPTLAQLNFRVTGNNIVLTNGSSTVELIIENSTKNIKGVLVNRGNGQTEFRQIQRLNDTTFVIGNDTLTFRGVATQNLQQVTDAGKTTTHYINADGGYYQNSLPLLMATDSLLRLGYHAGESNTSGGGNTAVGNGALQNNTTGRNNTAAGYHVLQQNTSGSYNVAVGVGALGSNTSGSGNVGAGKNALGANTSGSNNVGIGTNALMANTTGNENTAMGYNAAAANETGNGLTAVGANALASNTTGLYNTALGSSALDANVSGNRNTALGYGALHNTTGNDNTAVGKSAGNATGSSPGETFRNTAVGSGALGNVNGNQNTAVGAGALGSYGGSNNTAVGDSALYAAQNSSANNTSLGKNAGANIVGGANNITIGYGAYVPGANDNGQLSIGNLIYGTGVNGVEDIISNGKVGIKTKTPAYELDINGKLGVRTMDSISGAANILFQDPATGEIRKAAIAKQSFSQSAVTTVSGTDAETTIIGAGKGSLLVPAAAWFAGKSFRIVVRGVYSTSATNPAGLRFTIKLGNTVIAQSASMFLSSNKNDVPYEIRAELTCRTTGASGSVFAMGFIRNDGEYINTIDNGTSAATVDLSVNQTLNITATLSDDSAGNAVSAYIVTIEAIN